MKKVKIHNSILKIAKAEAEKSNVIRAKLSALLVDPKINQIYGKAHNKQFIGSKYFFSLHAEEMLILKTIGRFKEDISNFSVLIYRKKKRDYGTSKPCPKCRKKLELVGIKNIIYYDAVNGFVNEQI